jgi:NSS family neurotransmitter:Na+ symporter
VIMTYSAYLPARISLGQASATINLSVAVAATLAGLAIFPAVFHYGLKPGAGPSLVFVTLPAAFAQMPNGRIIGAFFFVMLVLAAFTVAVGMLEPVVAWIREKTGGKRGVVAWLTAIAAFAVGLPSLLSSSVLKDWHPLSMLPKFANKTFLDLLDFSIANVLLPLNAMLIALFVGWAVSRATVKDELNLSGLREGFFRFVIRYLAPLVIAGVMINLIAFSGS